MAIGFQRRASRQTRVQTSQIKTVPAPIGGINARDALAEMPATDAVSMSNWFPTPTYVAVRNGSQNWATGLPGQVETIMPYNGTTAYKKFAAAVSAFYDVTAEGAVGSPVVTGLSNARWQDCNFNALGGSVLLAVNGVDAPRRFDNAAQGAIEVTKNLVGGTSYVNGTYPNVPITGGTGSGAQATIVVSGNVVTAVTITTPGSGYLVGDTISVAAGNVGGSGSGFSIQVATVGGWSTTTISGTNTLSGGSLNPNNLITVTVFKQRVWFIEVATMNVWYTGIGAYQGALTLLPLGSVFKKGGYLMQMVSWTIDNVDGINDYAAFITSEGEVAVYQGYDPSTLATWSEVGTFDIGRPIGRRCTVKYGSDVLCITADGLVPLSQALLTDRLQPDVLLTDKIRNAINQDVQNNGDNFGWQCVEHPIGNKLVLNVPDVTDLTSHQWVMNTSSAAQKAWTQFNGWNASCWMVQQDSLYYGGGGVVVLADVGLTDVGAAITVDAKPAFTNFGDDTQKEFMMARPILNTSAPINPTITPNVDFIDTRNPSPLFSQGLAAPWNTSPWNTTPWGGIYPLFIQKAWLGCPGLGYWMSGRLSFQVKNIAVQWQATDYMYKAGGPL